MQSINITVINAWFMSAFLGTTVACVSLAVFALLRWSEAGAVYLFGGALIYFIGTFLVTIIFNVPRNNALAAVDPASASGASLWTSYLSSWTAWNHVRTAAALAAAGLLTIGLCLTRNG